MHHLEVLFFFFLWALPVSGCQAAALNQQQKNCQQPKHLSTCWTTAYLGDQGLSYVNCYSDALGTKQKVKLSEMKTGLCQIVEKHSAISRLMSPILYCPLGEMCLRLCLSPGYYQSCASSYSKSQHKIQQRCFLSILDG